MHRGANGGHRGRGRALWLRHAHQRQGHGNYHRFAGDERARSEFLFVSAVAFCVFFCRISWHLQLTGSPLALEKKERGLLAAPFFGNCTLTSARRDQCFKINLIWLLNNWTSSSLGCSQVGEQKEELCNEIYRTQQPTTFCHFCSLTPNCPYYTAVI